MTSIDFEKTIGRSRRKAGNYAFMARIPFAAFALGGMILIVILKLLGINQVVTTLAAIACILIYCGLVAYVASLRLRDDQLGDNCYYLGFLYTLASLSIALYQFTMSAGDSNSTAVSDIVANFGIALGSTIVGILLRVVINQARKDVLETERDARMMLTETMVNMRVQLDDAVIALRGFCAQTQQIAADAIADNAKQANAALDESVAKIAATSAAVLTKIDEAFEEFGKNTKRLNHVAAGTVEALEALVDRLEKMEAPSDLISKRLDVVIGTTEKAAATLRDRLEADEKGIAEAATRIKQVEEALKQAVGAIGTAGSNLSDVSEASFRGAKSAEAAAEKLTELTTSLGESLTEQRRMLNDIGAGSVKAAESLIEVQQQLATQARSNLDNLIVSVRNHNEALAEELARARRMTTETGNALADMAETLTERVRQFRNPVALEGVGRVVE